LGVLTVDDANRFVTPIGICVELDGVGAGVGGGVGGSKIARCGV